MALFGAIQIETAQPLGPPDGRYLIRPGAGETPTHVLVFAGAVATVVETAEPFADPGAAGAWLRHAEESDLLAALAVLERAMHSFRLIVADPSVSGPSRRQLSAARAGWGHGEALASGRFAESRELSPPKGPRFQRRAKLLEPHARLAAALSGREPSLVCAELALRASFDLEHGRTREASLGTLVALNAAVTELSLDGQADALAVRIDELRGFLPDVTAAAQTALSSPPADTEVEAVARALSRLEAALRARAVASA